MSYLDGLPDATVDMADWALQLKDGTLLPVHGPLLYTISPVLAGLVGTKPSGTSGFAVEVPCDKTPDVASTFLRWLYRQEVVWTLEYAKELAILSHCWNISGMQIGLSYY